MDMLDYCKTYTMVKSSYTNQESTEITLQDVGRQAVPQQKYENNGDCVVESCQNLSTKPADLRVPYETGENKLNHLKDVGSKKGIISSMNVKSQQRVSFDSEFTFAPKLNALSIKLAKERGEKITERKNYLSSARRDTEFTFKPKVSSNSARIMQHLKTSFMDRQQMHMEKQKRYIEATINSYQTRGKFSPVPSIKSPTRLKKIKKIKETDIRETSLEEDQLLLPGNVKPCNLPESTPVPNLLPVLNTVLNKSTEEEAVTCTNSSYDAENVLDESNSKHSLMSSSSSSDLTEKTPTCNTTNSFKDLMSLSSLELTKKTSKVKLSEKMSGSKSNQACKQMLETSPYNQSTENLYLRKQSIKRSVTTRHKRSLTHPLQKPSDAEKGQGSWDNSPKVENHSKAKGSLSRSQSQLVGFNLQLPGKLKYDDPSFDKVRHAKQVAESAIKHKRVFICHGPYPIVRATLRKRGWVEKHYRENLVRPKNKKTDSDDSEGDSCDSGDDSDIQNSVNHSPRSKDNKSNTNRKAGVSKSKKRPTARNKVDRNRKDNYNSSSDDDSDDENFDKEDWNAGYEDTGSDFEFSLMSRSVRNAVASFIWTTKRDDVDFKFLRKDQIVNHYCKAYSFTTKIGLSTNLRNLKWYDDADHFSFFPRSHLLGSDVEQLDFIDDYRLTAAINIIKWVIQRYENGNFPEDQISHSNKENSPRSTDQDQGFTKTAPSNQGVSSSPWVAPRGSSTVVPVKALTLALEACQEFVRCKEHLDIDEVVNKCPAMSDDSWDLIVEYSYQLKRHGAVIACAHPYLKQCQNTLEQMKEYLPQVDIDGAKNIWIVKPGAQSRGRGIMCMDRLDEIVKLVGNTAGKKEGRLVVQKYIERPLLIHGVKFDIRQWFLVTDWNPLTMWFYQDCYLRFCTQMFSLDDFHISIHLANNSIQKHFENNGLRDKRLPEENMWSSDDFKDYLKHIERLTLRCQKLDLQKPKYCSSCRKLGVGNKWDDVIYPGMKKAVIHALQSCQEIVEYRKNSFELYGADFVISEDYKPWLLEINCSPTMAASTAVTRKLCAQVLEDTMKVVLDRREDKNCDTGRYELAFKQPQVSAPTYIGINMAVEGKGIQKPPTHGKRRRDVSSCTTETTSLSRPKETPNVILNQSEASVSTDGKRPDVQNTEGSWAVGCMCIAQPIPVATTFYTTDDGKLKGLTARTRTPSSSEIDVSTHLQQRSPRAMKIPKAVLKYSSDNSIRQSTQLPISIGPDNNAKQF